MKVYYGPLFFKFFSATHSKEVVQVFDRLSMAHKSIDIFTKERYDPRMVQVNADSNEASILIHSTRYRRPIRLSSAPPFKRNYERGWKRKDLWYDKFSWVKYSKLDTPTITAEKLAKPIF